jgi:hypothetical protein
LPLEDESQKIFLSLKNQTESKNGYTHFIAQKEFLLFLQRVYEKHADADICTMLHIGKLCSIIAQEKTIKYRSV